MLKIYYILFGMMLLFFGMKGDRIENLSPGWETDSEERKAVSEIVDELQWQKELTGYDLWYGENYRRFRGELDSKEQKALEAFLPLLRGEEEFYGSVNGNYRYQENEREGYLYVSHSVTEPVTLEDWYYFLYREEYRKNWISEVAFADVDGDGEAEMLIDCRHNFILLLHRDGDQIYGIDFSVRGFQAVRENGLYRKSGGAANTEYYSISFQNGVFVEKRLAGQDYLDFYIGDQSVTQEEFEKWVEKEAGTAEYVEWHEAMNEENEKSAFEQLEGFANYAGEWMKKGNTQYCIYDFDRDGILELVVSSESGAENHFYHMDHNGITELGQVPYGKTKGEFNLRMTNVSWCDPETGRIYYSARNNRDVYYNSYYSEYYGYFYFEDGQMENRAVCVRYMEGEEVKSYYDLTSPGAYMSDLYRISPQEFDELREEYCTGESAKYISLYWVEPERGAAWEEILFDLILSYQKGQY